MIRYHWISLRKIFPCLLEYPISCLLIWDIAHITQRNWDISGIPILYYFIKNARKIQLEKVQKNLFMQSLVEFRKRKSSFCQMSIFFTQLSKRHTYVMGKIHKLFDITRKNISTFVGISAFFVVYLSEILQPNV